MKCLVFFIVILWVTLASGQSCGSLKPLANNNPSVDGFRLGIYSDGSIVYAGSGNFSQCYNQNPAVARIQGSAAYSPCGWAQNGELEDTTEPKYFFNHPNLHWYQTPQSTVSQVPNAVKIGNFYVGRVNLTSINGTFQQIAKVDPYDMFYKVSEGYESSLRTKVEILVCFDCPDGGTGPYCCENGANNPECILDFECIDLVDLNGNNPEVDGLLAGYYEDGSPIYPGVGAFPDCFQDPGIARIQTSGKPGYGAHSTCGHVVGGELHDSLTAQYYRNHPGLAWVNTTVKDVTKIPQAIKVGKFYVGRTQVYSIKNKSFYTQIGKISAGYAMYYVRNGYGEEKIKGAVEVLVCNNITTTTTVTTTTTTPTPTTTQPNNLCGTYATFDPATNISAPILDGVFGGYDPHDDKAVYVGVANGGNICFNSNPNPAYIRPYVYNSTSQLSPGGYIQCEGTLDFDGSSTVKYLVNNANYQWVKVSYETVETLPDRFFEDNNLFVRFRELGVYYMGAYNWNNGAVIQSPTRVAYPSNFEVLTCKNEPPLPPTTTVTTEAPLTTTAELNPNICESSFNVYSEPSHTYIKALCLVKSSVNYDTAKHTCQSNGMQLYTITSQDDYNALSAAYDSVYLGKLGRAFWINGRRDDDQAAWYVHRPGSEVLYRGALPKHLVVGGVCLAYGTLFSEKGTTGWLCDREFYTLCEYDVGVQRTTLAPTGPCGTFVKYDSWNYPNDPATYGFAAGASFKDNSTQYVGYGYYKNFCEDQNPIPGGIQITPKPGAYITCYNWPFYDSSDAYYLLNHPNLKWVKTNTQDMFSYTNALSVNGGTFPFFFGRGLLNGQYQLGKVHASHQSWDSLHYEGPNGETEIFTDFEILVCEET